MAASLDHIHQKTPMGATLTADGATFRVWAPQAHRVHVLSALTGDIPSADNELQRIGAGHWAGFWSGFRDGTVYDFWVHGDAGPDRKRDPYARELTRSANWKHSRCLVRDPLRYPWRVSQFRPAPFHEWIIYQLHIGAFYSPEGGKQGGTFFDVISKLPYLAELGVNVLQLLPVQEFPTTFSLGYNGFDYFSPENQYAIPDTEITHVLPAVNQLLTARGLKPLDATDLEGSANQLRCLVDLAHAHGLAVIFDVVYNHAGGDFDDASLFFFDCQHRGNNNDSQYFSDKEPDGAGGLCFALQKPEVRQFLINNARFLFEEYRIDGMRHDHVRMIIGKFAEGWGFCRDLNSNCKHLRPDALQHAELWPTEVASVRPGWEGGAAFDTNLCAGLRDALYEVLGQAAGGSSSRVNLTSVFHELWPRGFPESWQGVQNVETHDEVHVNKGKQRIARRADGSDTRSPYARGRSRVINGLLLTAPGIPMMFMGQEFLEDKPWDDNLDKHPNLRLYWDGLTAADSSMRDHCRFTRELCWLRRRLPGLTGEGFHPFHVHDDDRVIAFQRWVPNVGQDVVVVASLNEATYQGYRIGFPSGGQWREVFNSDVYDRWVNPNVRGNGGAVFAESLPWQGMPYSADLVIPANSCLIFTKDG